MEVQIRAIIHIPAKIAPVGLAILPLG